MHTVVQYDTLIHFYDNNIEGRITYMIIIIIL